MFRMFTTPREDQLAALADPMPTRTSTQPRKRTTPSGTFELSTDPDGARAFNAARALMHRGKLAPKPQGPTRAQLLAHPFLKLVASFQARTGCSKAEAIREVRAQSPSLHQSFLAFSQGTAPPSAPAPRAASSPAAAFTAADAEDRAAIKLAFELAEELGISVEEASAQVEAAIAASKRAPAARRCSASSRQRHKVEDQAGREFWRNPDGSLSPVSIL